MREPPHVARLLLLLTVLVAVALAGCGSPVPDGDFEGGPAGNVSPADAGSQPPTATREADSGPRAPYNFGFIFRYGCIASTLNTFKGTFTRQIAGVSPKTATVPMVLSEQEEDRIFRRMREIDLFSYPEMYAIPTPASGITSVVIPANRYYFKVSSGKQTKELSWVDEITDPNPPEARRLRALFELIEHIIQSHSAELSKLPEARIACA